MTRTWWIGGTAHGAPGVIARRKPEVGTSDGGFTLVEILLAIVLVGILSAVVVVGISNLTSKGSSAACTASADAARAGSAVYFSANGVYPSTLLEMTSANPPALVLPAGVSLNATASGSSAVGSVASGAGWSLTIAPGAAGATPTFSCTNGTAAANGTAACPGTFSKWVGEYYSTIDLTGSPTLCRDDPTLDFDWGGGSPASTVPVDNFSARWTQRVVFTAGVHSFTVGSDDGSRLYIDGTLVLDYWNDHSYGTANVSQTLTAGAHLVVVEFYERGGYARASLVWT